MCVPAFLEGERLARRATTGKETRPRLVLHPPKDHKNPHELTQLVSLSIFHAVSSTVVSLAPLSSLSRFLVPSALRNLSLQLSVALIFGLVCDMFLLFCSCLDWSYAEYRRRGLVANE